MSPFDREAPWWAESPTHEALAPSDGANTIRKLTVRFVSTTTPAPKPRSGRPHSLSRPVFCFQGAACARGTYPTGFGAVSPPAPGPQGPCGARSQSNECLAGRQPEPHRSAGNFRPGR
jgi:hypothetical protein